MQKSTRSSVVIVLATITNYVLWGLTGGTISGSWWEKFTTGAPMAGIFAVCAAFIALYGIKKQVAETSRATDVNKAVIEANRKVSEASLQATREISAATNETNQAANEATARKNADDQWWATLKWTYAEAKESPNGETSKFQRVAAAQILGSLNEEPENLSAQQRHAVAAIRDIFDQSKNAEVREAVRPIFKASGVTAPSEYADALALAIQQLTFGPKVTLSRSGSFKMGDQSWDMGGETQTFEITLSSEEGKEVAISVLIFSPLTHDEFSSDEKTLYNTFFGSSFPQARLRDFVKEDPANRAALFVLNWPQVGSQYEKYSSIVEGIMQRESEFIRTVTWREGEPLGEIETVLRQKLEA